MEISVSPLVKEPKLYGFEYPKLRKFLRIKKTAQRYNSKGEKVFKLEDNEASSRKSRPIILKHDKLDGPFVVVLFGTDGDVNAVPSYTYQGYIKVDEGEFAYVYRDTIDDYPDALFCDDNTLFMDIRNKEKGEKYAAQIDGEPTNMDCWQFDGNDDTPDGFYQKQMKEKKTEIAKKFGLDESKVYVVIQLDC